MISSSDTELLGDPTAKVIFQDFFNENVFQMNFFLEVLKLPTLDSVEKSDPVNLINGMIRINQQKGMNVQEEAINNYLVCCTRRYAPEGTVVKNHSRLPIIRAPSKNKTLFNQHWTSNHSGVLKAYNCPWEGCSDVLYLIRQLHTHIYQQHKLDGKNDNPCPLCGKKGMYTKEAWHKHLRSIHKKNDIFECLVENCDKKFSTKTRRDDHYDEFLLFNEQIPCEHCGEKIQDIYQAFKSYIAKPSWFVSE